MFITHGVAHGAMSFSGAVPTFEAFHATPMAHVKNILSDV